MTCNVMHEGHAKNIIGVHFLQIYRAAPLRHGALQRPLHWISDHEPVGPQTPRLPTPQNTVSVCHRSGGTAQQRTLLPDSAGSAEFVNGLIDGYLPFLTLSLSTSASSMLAVGIVLAFSTKFCQEGFMT